MNDTTTYQNFYGRFKGRPLGVTKISLMNDLSHRVRIDIKANKHYHPQQFFPDNYPRFNKFILEIGFGGGEHLAAMAQQNPEIGFIGCEVFVNGIASMLGHIKNRQLNNVKIHDAIIQNLLPTLVDECLDEIYILFPDPWPKLRHKKRQLINVGFLDILSSLLPKGGFIYMASDDMHYVQSMLDGVSMTASLKLIGHDNKPAIDRSPTKYEKKAIDDNRTCHYLTVVKT